MHFHTSITAKTYDVVDLGLLALGRTLGVPAHADAVATVEDVKLLERDLGLRALSVHELLATNEGWCYEIERLIVSAVDDDRDSRRIVYEILRQGGESKLIGVILDELLEDAGSVVRIIVVQAIAIVRRSCKRCRSRSCEDRACKNRSGCEERCGEMHPG